MFLYHCHSITYFQGTGKTTSNKTLISYTRHAIGYYEIAREPCTKKCFVMNFSNILSNCQCPRKLITI